MKVKILAFLLAFGISLLGINLLLWQWDKSADALIEPTGIHQEVSTKPAMTENYSVEKLNSQVSVKQLRQALFTEPGIIAPEIGKLSENNELNNRDTERAQPNTAVELNSEIERLSQELQALQKSVQ